MYGFKECSSCGALYNREHCCSNVSSVDNFVRDPNSPSQPQTSSFNQRHCFHCKNPLEEAEHCKRCTCKRCESGLSKGFCFICASSNENSSFDNPNPNSFNDPPNVFSQPPQHQYETYSCEFCGGNSHPGLDCQKENTPVFDQGPCYNQDFGFNQPSHYSLSQPQYETYSCELCGNDSHYGYDCSPQFPLFPVIHQPPQEMSIQDMEDLKQQYLDKMKSLINEFSIKDYRDEKIDIKINELKENFNGMSIEINKKKKLQQLEQEYTIAITPVLLTVEPDNSLSMGDEHLSTILETESDELIKSSVENLVPIPSESEDECGCDVPDCDDSQTTNFSTFSNPLFDDSTSSDDESSHEEVIHEISFKTYSNPLFDLDEEIISSEFNPIHNEDLDSTPKNDRFDTESYLLESLLDRVTLMASSPKKFDFLLDEFESFHVDYPDSGDSTIDMVEDIPVDVPNILPTHPTLHIDFDFIASHNDLRSDLDVSSPSKDRNKIYDPRICIEVESTRFLATFSPVIDTLLPFSSENEDKVFNHGVLASKEKSPPSSSHRGFKAFKLFHQKSPMLIYGEDIPILDVPFLYLYPP
ncbi:hypothetical protein Tco_0476264 [Tanacetum coccineum]